MKGVSATIITTVLILIAAVAVPVVYIQMNRIASNVVAKGEEQMVDAKIAPKFLAISCMTGHGYFKISSDEPLQGKVYYKVKYGLDEVASGFSSVDIADVGKVYFNATMTEDKEYAVEITSKYWSLRENCIASQDPGLVLYLKFNESSGTTATDWSGNGNDAAVNASWINGTTDYGLRFDGVNQYAKVDSTTGFDSRKFTLAFWTLREYPPSTQGYLIKGGSFSVSSQSDDDFDFTLSGGDTVSLQLDNKTWHHFTMKYDGSTLRVYKNCTISDSKVSSYSPSSGDFYLGKGPSGNNIAGAVDEVYFFSRSLDDDEIAVFCNPLLSVQGNAYNGTWSETDGYCPPEDPEDPDCIII